jgi:mannose-6-phosphate isomerase
LAALAKCVIYHQFYTATERVYRTPAPEFELSRIEVSSGHSHSSRPGHSADALVLLEGEADFQCTGSSTPLRRGQIVLAPFGLEYTLRSASRAVLYKATVPVS